MSGWNFGKSTGTNSSTTGGFGSGSFGSSFGNSFGSSFGSGNSFGKGFNQTKGAVQQPTQYQAVLDSDPLFTRIWNVRSAYNPNSKSYRFCFVFYNKRPENNNTWPTTPQNFEETDWCKICSEMPDKDHLVPCPLYGFPALKARHESQKEIVKKLQERMSILQSKIREMSSFYDTEISGKFYQIEKNITIITQLLIKVVGVKERKHQGSGLTLAEESAKSQLEAWSNELDKPKMFLSALSELENKVLIGKSFSGSKKISRESLDSDTKAYLAKALAKNQDAIEYLQKIIQNMKKTIASLEDSMI